MYKKKTGRQDDTKITFNDIILNVNYHKLKEIFTVKFTIIYVKRKTKNHVLMSSCLKKVKK